MHILKVKEKLKYITSKNKVFRAGAVLFLDQNILLDY